MFFYLAFKDNLDILRTQLLIFTEIILHEKIKIYLPSYTIF